MIIDGAVITNGSHRCKLYIQNSVPILRQKDILSEKDADSPARRIYFTIQLMYIDRANLKLHHKTYWQLVDELIQAVPSALTVIDAINDMILKGQYYQALKGARRLIKYEKEIVSRVREFA